MERLTTNKDVSEMGMYELALNCCYIKDRLARYREFEMDMDARDFARNLMTTLANEDMPTDDDLFDEEIMENLMYDQFSDVKGLIALFYRNLWAMAELRESLKEYEDAEEQGLLLRLPCKVGTPVYMVAEDCGGDTLDCRCMDCEDCRYLYTFVEQNAFDTYMVDDIGKTVFLTKEEAEQALADMKGV